MGKIKKTPYKITPSNENGVKSLTVSVGGNLSLDEVEAIKLILIENIDKFQKFHLIVNDVENIDLGIIQLFYSFKWSVEKKSKSVTFDFKLPEDHKQILEHSGFSDLINSNL